MQYKKTLLHEIAIEAMKALIIAQGKDGISFADCDDIAGSAYDVARTMVNEKRHVEKTIVEDFKNGETHQEYLARMLEQTWGQENLELSISKKIEN